MPSRNRSESRGSAWSVRRFHRSVSFVHNPVKSEVDFPDGGRALPNNVTRCAVALAGRADIASIQEMDNCHDMVTQLKTLGGGSVRIPSHKPASNGCFRYPITSDKSTGTSQHLCILAEPSSSPGYRHGLLSDRHFQLGDGRLTLRNSSLVTM
jgi:hypothetical protein